MKQPLTEKEQNALDIIVPCVEQAYTTDEITLDVALGLGISLNSAKGYLGQLTLKGYIQKCATNVNGRRIYQFEIS